MKTSASALLVGATAVAAAAQQAPRDLLTALHHLARPVLIFAGPGDARAAEQYTALLQHGEACKDRQVHVVLLAALPVAHPENGSAVPATSVASATEQEALRKRFHVGPEAFAVILVGKDGGEKMRSDRPVPWETLQSTIDSMPMRQTEIRTKGR